MLQIYLYGPVESGFIDVNPDSVLNMEALTEIFDEDLSIGEFSLPVEIPWTSLNRRRFGFAERLENFSTATKYFRCDVYERGFPEMLNAKLTILERSGNFSYTKGSFSASISGTRGLYGSAIKGKTLRHLQLGGKITWSGEDSRTFARKVMMGNYPQYGHFVFAPVAIESFIHKDRPDYNGEFLAMDCVNNVIVTGGGPDSWTFGRPRSANPLQAAAPGEAEYLDYFTVPFFKVKSVLRACFEEFGYSVSGALLDGTEFEDLVLFNNRGIEDYNFTTRIDNNRQITPSNHLPNNVISEFLKAVFSFFNIYPVFTGANAVRLKYRKDIIAEKTVLPLNGICGRSFSSTYQNTEAKTGYKLSYQWDGADGFHSDRVKDIAEKTLVATVARRSDLSTLNVGYQLTTDHIAFVSAENMYYVIADGTTSPLKWDVWAEALNDYISGDGDRSVEVALAPLCTYVEFSESDALFFRRDYVGCRLPGAYKNSRGVQVKADFDISVFYAKKRVISNVNKPVSFNHNRDGQNNKILPYSLAWSGEDGIAKAFHESWQKVQENGEVVKTTILYNHKVRKQLEESNVVEINSVLFLPYKIERSIPMKSTGTIYLMPL